MTPVTSAARPNAPRAIRNAAEYGRAVTEVDQLLDAGAARGTKAGDRLERLSILIEAYDDAHYPLAQKSTPQSIVLFMLEQKGLTRADLVAMLGSKSRVSEFLSGKRGLSLAQIGTLRRELGISADLLVGSGSGADTTEFVSTPPVRRVSENAGGLSAAESTRLAIALEDVVARIAELSERIDRLTAPQLPQTPGKPSPHRASPRRPPAR